MVIINKDTEELIKKLKIEVVIRIIIASVLFVGVLIFMFIIQKREWQTMVTVVLTIVSTLYFAYILYVITQYLRKIKAYEKFVTAQMHSSKIGNDIKVLAKEKDTYVIGFRAKVYSVREIDSHKDFYLYIDEFHKDELIVDKVYAVITYHSVLIEYEEKKDEVTSE